ncbi:MAG: SDR family NAD(P)-dependent oxidoreductase [Clostridiales bacterium]|nr:SDR family NAD(P)-dependent oxidoreductase [Clostridiales bacterium]
MQLDKVCAVVTGGGSGMGRATAEAIVKSGGKACIVDFVKDRCEEVVAELGSACFYEVADVADPARAEEIVKAAVAKFGYVNVVVNCAGVGSGTRILPREGGVFPIETFKRVLDINLVGTFNYLCQGALAMSEAPPNEDGERGVIINTTSQAYKLGQIGQAAYSASKGGVEALTLPVARELARVGVRINTIVPGLVTTNMGSVDMLGKAPRERPPRPEGAVDSAAQDFIFPLRRGFPEEFASLALEIIRNGLLNGASFAFDGAMRFRARW